MLFASLSNFEFPLGVDGVELRLDLFSSYSLNQVQEYLDHSPIPVLLTHRTASEKLTHDLLLLKPSLFDLDISTPFLDKIIASYPNTKFILSYHNFEETPKDLEAIYQKMVRFDAWSYKIAAKCVSVCDALRLLLFSKKYPKVSAICMGEKGSFARTMGPVVGNKIDYASLRDKTAPGQLSISELTQIYRYRSLNSETALYGLIGKPVDQSIGHLYHNGVFEKKKINALYVKMEVEESVLDVFFLLAKEVGFKGLSVTMPLKEKVGRFCNRNGAINTLLIGDAIMGTNTDGMGALDAIEKRMKVSGKRVVILGAGGAARGIACEAKKRGADIYVVNRTVEKGEALAKDVGGFATIPSDYDIVINCAKEAPEFPLLEKKLAMDIVYYPKETSFLKRAKQLDCELIFGEEMFFGQAAAQQDFWFQ
jgi:3-dehydroquinate dehydratase/shikimate dehydrogenase